jgi:hypothetical protein
MGLEAQQAGRKPRSFGNPQVGIPSVVWRYPENAIANQLLAARVRAGQTLKSGAN